LEDGVLWATSPTGLYAAVAEDGPVRFERFDEPDARHAGLSAGHVSGLALDGRGRLWVGLFDGGVDVIDPATGERAGRIDDPLLHEINAIVADGGDRMWIASSRGLAVFDGERKSRVFGEKQGLVGENVAAIALGAGADGSGVAVATNRGLSLVDGPVARSLTAFHGLPSNHTYAAAVLGGRVWIGTLGGVAEVEGLRVGRVFSMADSRLPHNWVNALVAFEGRLYVGTYGGGVATLLPNGELEPAEETAGLEVNPGAMAAVGRRLYVGTLDAGLWALDVDSGRWTKVTTALSSLNVTAIAADATYLYIGTEHGITRIERTALS
jgi:ligand-binding sensor domain-containing protein